MSDYKGSVELPSAPTVSSRITDEWETPPETYDPLNAEFRFTLDAAANEHNHKTPLWLGPGGVEPDGLAAVWRGHVWCNPLYSDIEPWVAHAWASVDPKAGPLRPGIVVMLVPATRTEQDWWQKYVEPWRDGGATAVERAILEAGAIDFSVRFLPRRVHFIPPPGVKASSPRFGCCLLVWRMGQL